ncbi:2-oxo acid dehydrogenase subunit E2 [Porticoccaceae bacterium]|nr:2-oxo acid dehydrogenase subunit E2 [Porticoccaceae bacterium]
MAKKYLMPKLAMAMNEGTINEWLIDHGEQFDKDAPLATIETEKVAYDVAAPEGGYLCIIEPAGETVECDTLIAWICETVEEVEQYAKQTAGADTSAVQTTVDALKLPDKTVPVPVKPIDNGARIIASPLAKKMAKNSGLNLNLVNGTGPNGRIVKRDVNDALSEDLHLQSASTSLAKSREIIRIPMTGMRKVISERMMQSLQSTAQLSSSWESDITDLMAVRKKFVDRQESLGTKISVNAFLIRAIAYAIRQVPIANACFDGDEIVIYDNINIGIAISMPGSTEYDSGLIVAVLHNVERMGLVEIDIEMKALTERVRSGQSRPEDLSGSTITLSSTAGIAPPGMTTTPVLNLPNASLVGPSTPIKRPVVHNDEITVRTMLPVSFTFDHCLLDGEPAARFMSALHDALENPELMLA